MYVAENINESYRTRLNCCEPPFGPSPSRDDGKHDHRQQHEPTERAYKVQKGTQINPSGQKHYQPIESNASDADPPRNTDSAVLRGVHHSPLYQQTAICGRTAIAIARRLHSQPPPLTVRLSIALPRKRDRTNIRRSPLPGAFGRRDRPYRRPQ